MELMKVVFTIAITMAITVTLTMNGIGEVEKRLPFEQTQDISSTVSRELSMHDEKIVLPSKRGSRFLAEVANPRAADHCNQDNDVCYAQGGNTTCCNNKCMNLSTDKHNCGLCKNKCKFTQACCRGQCVNLSFDKRHCGRCNNRCQTGLFCVYGMCDYA